MVPELDFRAPQCVTKRIFYRHAASFQYVRINLRRTNISMPELLLNGANIHAPLKKMRSERMPKSMAVSGLFNVRLTSRPRNRSLYTAFVDVVAWH